MFCPACKTLQSPPRDYFEFYSLPRNLTIDTADLQSRFYSLSRQLHPDRFTRKPPREQEYSLEASSILNDGLRVLRDPVLRAEYVMSGIGPSTAEQRVRNVPPELLEEVFELNLALEELRSGDSSARGGIEKARHDFESILALTDSNLADLFIEWDLRRDPATLVKIRGVLDRRKYIQNLVRDVDQALETAGS
jgi:molecular chaperone HscB